MRVERGYTRAYALNDGGGTIVQQFRCWTHVSRISDPLIQGQTPDTRNRIAPYARPATDLQGDLCMICVCNHETFIRALALEDTQRISGCERSSDNRLQRSRYEDNAIRSRSDLDGVCRASL